MLVPGTMGRGRLWISDEDPQSRRDFAEVLLPLRSGSVFELLARDMLNLSQIELRKGLANVLKMGHSLLRACARRFKSATPVGWQKTLPTGPSGSVGISLL
jgi:hypothetical protein